MRNKQTHRIYGQVCKISTSAPKWSKPCCFSLVSFFLLWDPCHLYFFLVVSSGSPGGESALFPVLRAQLLPDWWHLSAQNCRLLHPSVLETPTYSVKATGTARFPRVRPTNRIVISFTDLTQAVSPQRQSFLREHFLSDKTHEATIFVKRLHLTFGPEKIWKIIL